MKRELTDAEKAECAALKAIFLRRKQEVGLTQEAAAHFLGYKTQGAVSQYLNGKIALNLEAVIGFSKLLECRAGDFCPRLGVLVDPPSQTYTIGQIEPWDSATPLNDEDVEVPLYKEVEMAAGVGANQQVEINGRKVRLSRASLRTAGVSPENAACAMVTGDSMADKILDGAAVGVDRGRTQIKDGKIYAIDHGGMLRIKYLHRLPGGGLRLRSHNKAYDDEDLTAEQFRQDIRILGWVFWWSTVDAW